MKEAFERLIKDLDPNMDVLEVGVNGHDGENTSVFVRDQFSDPFGINIRPEKIEDWKQRYPDANCAVADWYEYEDETHDLIILDLNIENNLKDWSDKELARAHRLLNYGGFLINYIMTTTEYGDPNETPTLIAAHRDSWWGSFKNEDIGKKLNALKGWEFIVAETETRRPYITWVLLKKK